MSAGVALGYFPPSLVSSSISPNHHRCPPLSPPSPNLTPALGPSRDRPLAEFTSRIPALFSLVVFPNLACVPGFVLQGPHGTYSHASVEAVDIYVSIGTPVKSMSSGVVTLTGWEMPTVTGSKFVLPARMVILYRHLCSLIGNRRPGRHSRRRRYADRSPGASSSVPGFANPHLHMEYRGIAYNSCPAGGVQVPDGCVGAVVGKSNACLINGKPIYTK